MSLNWIKQNLKKYLPDILFLLGTWIISYNFLRPQKSLLEIDLTRYYTGYKVLGIMLIAIAIDIAIRKYISRKQ